MADGKLVFDPFKATPKLARKISHILLFASGFWALFQPSLPIHIPDEVAHQIDRWLLFLNAAYRFVVGFFHWQVDEGYKSS